jgi:hypothetical protein
VVQDVTVEGPRSHPQGPAFLYKNSEQAGALRQTAYLIDYFLADTGVDEAKQLAFLVYDSDGAVASADNLTREICDSLQ